MTLSFLLISHWLRPSNSMTRKPAKSDHTMYPKEGAPLYHPDTILLLELHWACTTAVATNAGKRGLSQPLLSCDRAWVQAWHRWVCLTEPGSIIFSAPMSLKTCLFKIPEVEEFLNIKFHRQLYAGCLWNVINYYLWMWLLRLCALPSCVCPFKQPLKHYLDGSVQ